MYPLPCCKIKKKTNNINVDINNQFYFYHLQGTTPVSLQEIIKKYNAKV